MGSVATIWVWVCRFHSQILRARNVTLGMSWRCRNGNQALRVWGLLNMHCPLYQRVITWLLREVNRRLMLQFSGLWVTQTYVAGLPSRSSVFVPQDHLCLDKQEVWSQLRQGYNHWKSWGMSLNLSWVGKATSLTMRALCVLILTWNRALAIFNDCPRQVEYIFSHSAAQDNIPINTTGLYSNCLVTGLQRYECLEGLMLYWDWLSLSEAPQLTRHRS